jgi:DNA-directed RNA polymerase specialized sigma24 family protein
MLGPLLAVAHGGRARLVEPSGAVVDGAGPGDFDGVILVHIDAAYNLARYLTGDVELAEDIVQEALLKAYRGFAPIAARTPRPGC